MTDVYNIIFAENNCTIATCDNARMTAVYMLGRRVSSYIFVKNGKRVITPETSDVLVIAKILADA